MAIDRAVVYDSLAFNAGIKSLHCTAFDNPPPRFCLRSYDTISGNTYSIGYWTN